jgi:hypothetical protein
MTFSSSRQTLTQISGGLLIRFIFLFGWRAGIIRSGKKTRKRNLQKT